MNKKKKIVIAILATLISIILIVGITLISVNVVKNNKNRYAELIKNGNFESKSDHWTISNYDKNANVKIQGVSKNSDQHKYLGNEYILFSAPQANSAAYISQNVNLKANRYYKLSVSLNIPNQFLASGESDSNPGFYMNFAQDPSMKGFQERAATTNWTNNSIIFKVGKSDKYTLKIGIGSPELGLSKGEASIDNVSLKEITKEEALASKQDIQTLNSQPIIKYNHSQGSIATTVLLTLFSFIFIVVIGILLAIKYKNKKDDNSLLPNKYLNNGDSTKLIVKNQRSVKNILLSSAFILTIISILAFVIRFLVIYKLNSVSNLLQNKIDISNTIAKNSIFLIYEKYPKNIVEFGYLYIYYYIGMFANAIKMSPESVGFGMLIKLPDLIAEMITIYVLFVYFINKKSKLKALTSAGMFALLPVFFISQYTIFPMSSVAILFSILMFISIVEKKFHMTSIYFFAGFIFEYNLLMLLPFIIGIFVIATRRLKLDGKDIRFEIAFSFLASLLALIILSIPFDVSYIKNGKPFYFLTVVYNNLAEVNTLAVNTYNLYSLLTVARTIPPIALKVVYILVVVAIFCGGFSVYYMHGKEKDMLLVAALIFIATGVVGVGSTIAFYLVGLALLLLYAMINQDRRIYSIFTCFATILTLNVLTIYSISGAMQKSNGSKYLLFNYNDAGVIVMSLITLLVFIYFVYVTYLILIRRKHLEYNIDIIKIDYIKNKIKALKDKKELKKVRLHKNNKKHKK